MLLPSINIGWDPTINAAGLELTWHTIFMVAGMIAGVFIGARLAMNRGFSEDDAYGVALLGLPLGMVGARALFVLENRERFEGQWLDAFRMDGGGISVYGAIIGGVAGAVIFGWIRRLPVRRGLDAAIIGILVGMAIGRIGDLVNGEHIARSSDLPWAIVYTNPKSASWQIGPTHPATTYEMIGDLLIVALLLVLLWTYGRTKPSLTFFAGVALYSAMRFGVSYLRLDSCASGSDCPDYVVRDWMTFPQAVSAVTWIIGVAGLAWALGTRSDEEPERRTVATAPG